MEARRRPRRKGLRRPRHLRRQVELEEPAALGLAASRHRRRRRLGSRGLAWSRRQTPPEQGGSRAMTASLVRDGRELEDLADLQTDLRAVVEGEVRFDAGTRAAYSTDGSNFRQVPIGVVVPRSIEAGVEAVTVCREHDAPLLSRGGGTSLAGQCTNEAVMIDWAKYCNRLLHVDPDRRTCVVEPGIVLDVLNEQLGRHGLRYGPEPATHPNCTIGGMIGNNSCGATAQRSGKVV